MRVRFLRYALMAGTALPALAIASCATHPGYVICDDTKPGTDCGNNVAPVIVNDNL